MNTAVERQIPLRRVLLAMTACLAVLAPLSLLIGRLSSGASFGFGDPALAWVVLNEIRLPRTALALLVGGTLGIAGQNSLLLPLGAVAGSMLALAAVYVLAGRHGSLIGLVLAGIGINALAAAFTSLALNFAPSPYAALEMLFWMFGSLADRSLSHVALVVPLMIAGWIMVTLAARGLDALSLGEDTAESLGFSVRRTQWLVIAGSALAVGAAVAVTGVIGFVGLVVPHLLRPFVGFHPSRLLLPSFLAGALLTMLADISVRLMPPGPELKLGVVTALLGAPVFLHIVLGRAGGRL